MRKKFDRKFRMDALPDAYLLHRADLLDFSDTLLLLFLHLRHHYHQDVCMQCTFTYLYTEGGAGMNRGYTCASIE